MHLRAARHRSEPLRERRHSDQTRRHRADPAQREAHDGEHRRGAAGTAVLLPGARREWRHARIRELHVLSVLCLRPEADFARLDALPPRSLTVTYLTPDDPSLAALIKEASALVIPAVGPKLPAALFDGSVVKLVQVTGAGL